MAQKKMKSTRRKRTVQIELKPWRWVRDLDLKRRWKMKQRERTERMMRDEMNVTVVRSKAELRIGDAGMDTMDQNLYRTYVYVCTYIFIFSDDLSLK